jgi:hypothetical protein
MLDEQARFREQNTIINLIYLLPEISVNAFRS